MEGEAPLPQIQRQNRISPALRVRFSAIGTMMAEVTFVLDYLTEVAAGVTVLTALAGIALSMTLFLKLGRQPSRTVNPIKGAADKPTQLEVLKESIGWVRSFRTGKGLRVRSGTAPDTPAR